MSYVLWVDFYEDQDTVDEAWYESSRQDIVPWEHRLRRVLDVAGPVPWDQKEALLAQLAGDVRWHPHILSALIGSAFDAYGQVEVSAARGLLTQLTPSEDSPGLTALRDKLQMPQ